MNSKIWFSKILLNRSVTSASLLAVAAALAAPGCGNAPAARTTYDYLSSPEVKTFPLVTSTTDTNAVLFWANDITAARIVATSPLITVGILLKKKMTYDGQRDGLAKQKTTLEIQAAQLDDGIKQAQDAKAAETDADKIKALDSTIADLTAKRAAVQAGLDKINAGLPQLDAGLAQIDGGLAQAGLHNVTDPSAALAQLKTVKMAGNAEDFSIPDAINFGPDADGNLSVAIKGWEIEGQTLDLSNAAGGGLTDASYTPYGGYLRFTAVLAGGSYVFQLSRRDYDKLPAISFAGDVTETDNAGHKRYGMVRAQGPAPVTAVAAKAK